MKKQPSHATDASFSSERLNAFRRVLLVVRLGILSLLSVIQVYVVFVATASA